MSLNNPSSACECQEEITSAQQRAENVLKQRLGFLSTVSHEIRTPLNAIIGITDLLQKTKNQQEQEEYIKILKQTSNSLLELVNNVLDFSKIKSGILRLHNKPFDLRNTITRSLYGEKIKADTKKLELEINIDPRLPENLIGDSVKLGQVFMNLVSNAIKFTEVGKIRVSVEVKELTPAKAIINCAVSDTGIGIPEEQIENIFKAFNQGSDDINIRYAGTGLGLSISKAVIRMLGGQLLVKSIPGEGSEFSFSLHLPISTLIEEETFEEKTAAVSVEGMKVLLVEDNKINVLVAEKYLSDWGVIFDTVFNGQEALERIFEKNYDLVLMDLQMPVMDGFAVMKALQELPDNKFQDLPVIAFTAASEQLYQEEITNLGFSNFVSKPFKPEDLLMKMAKIQESKEELTGLKNSIHIASELQRSL